MRVHGRLEHADAPAAYLRTTLVNVCLAWRGRRAMARERQPRPDATWVDPGRLDREQVDRFIAGIRELDDAEWQSLVG